MKKMRQILTSALELSAAEVETLTQDQGNNKTAVRWKGEKDKLASRNKTQPNHGHRIRTIEQEPH